MNFCIPLKVSLRGRIGRDGLIVFSLQCKRMRKRNPGRPKSIIDEQGFPKVPPGFLPPLSAVVPESDGVPRGHRLGLAVDQLVCEEEEPRAEIGEMLHAGEMQGKRCGVGVVDPEYSAECTSDRGQSDKQI